MTRGAATAALLGLLSLPLVGTGCGAYVIQGTIVQGLASDMAFVSPDDPRLADPPVASVRITVFRDPDKLARHQAGTTLSDAHGRFSLHIDEMGAGWMDEDWQIYATKSGYATAATRQRLTGGTKKLRLLIMLAPGASDTPREDDLIEEYERFR